MKTLYSFFSSAAEKLLPISTWFSPKMKQFVTGRKQVFNRLEREIGKNDQIIWFHAASLGEYEQGVPVMEAVKQDFPKYKILVTFFSPSGYEVKKNNTLSDITTYLPLDTQKNARKFIQLARPALAIFIKYEIWPNYLLELKKQNVRTLLISGQFRKKQFFFKAHGGFMRRALTAFDHIFVQDAASKALLENISIKNVSVSGDTRFDRVSHQIEHNNHLGFMEAFKNGKLCIVCGSTWPEDELLLVEYINRAPKNLKFVIAPHEIKPKAIEHLREKIHKKTSLYSQRAGQNLEECPVLLIDTVGLLTKIYSYADIAYVGGAMGNSGLHNILEPATFGVPVIIGKYYKHFPEAIKLQKLAGLFAVKNEEELAEIMNKLVKNSPFRKTTGMISGHFVQHNTGATQKTMERIRAFL